MGRPRRHVGFSRQSHHLPFHLWHHHRRRAADLCSRNDTFIVTLCHHGRELLRGYQQHRSRLPSQEIQEAQRIDPMVSRLKPTLQRLQYLLCLCPGGCFTSPGGRRASQHRQRAWKIRGSHQCRGCVRIGHQAFPGHLRFVFRKHSRQLQMLWEDNHNDCFEYGFAIFTAAAGAKLKWWADPAVAKLIASVIIVTWIGTIRSEFCNSVDWEPHLAWCRKLCSLFFVIRI